MMTAREIGAYKPNMEVGFFLFHIVFTFSTVSTSGSSCYVKSQYVYKRYFVFSFFSFPTCLLQAGDNLKKR